MNPSTLMSFFMITMRSTSYALTSVVIWLLIAACSTTHSPVSGPATEVRPVLSAALPAETWLPRQHSSTQQYLIYDSSLVTINSDSTSKVVPIVSTVFYSVTIAATNDGSGLATLTGALDSTTAHMTIESKSASNFTHPEIFRATLTRTNEINVSTSGDFLTCSNRYNSLSARIFELVVSYPKSSAKVGDTWSDTVTSITCHGKTPLKQQAIRRYEIQEFTHQEEQAIVKIQRYAVVTFTNAVSQPNNKLSVSGGGSSTATLYLNRDNGLLLLSDNQSRTELIVTTSRGVFPFTQNTITHITSH